MLSFGLFGTLLVMLMHNAASNESVIKGNAFIEELLSEMKTDKSSVYSIDPLKIQNVDEPTFQTTNLIVKGLSKLKRDENCSVSLSGNTTKLICRIVAEDLMVTFDFWAKALFFWFNGEGEIKVDKLLLELHTSLQSGAAKLDDLKVIKLGEFHVENINGLSIIFNWMLRMIAEKLFRNSKEKITDAIKKTSAEALNNIMKSKARPGF